MREKPSKEESDSSGEDESHSENQEPEYAFAGFNVEFSEKIVLTPVAADVSSQEKGRVGP